LLIELKEEEKEYLNSNINAFFEAADCDKNGFIDLEEVNIFKYIF